MASRPTLEETKWPTATRQCSLESSRPFSFPNTAYRRNLATTHGKILSEPQISIISTGSDRNVALHPTKIDAGAQYGPVMFNEHVQLASELFKEPAPLSGPFCTCQCTCGSTSGKEPSTVKRKDEMKGENLSWRRLELSRSKLKVSATTSELLAGFALVAMVELNINDPTTVPDWLFVVFSVSTTILVSIHVFALMISTYILPNIDAVSQIHVKSLVGDSPHEQMRLFIELAWSFSTVVGLFLFLFDVIVICWIQFLDYSFIAALSGTIILGPMLLIFIGIVLHFYKSLSVYSRFNDHNVTIKNNTLNDSQA